MLINYPTDGAICGFLVLFHSPGGATYRCTVYHGTAAVCISIELYEIVQLRSGDGVALPLSMIVGVVCLTMRGGPPIRCFFI